MRKRNLFMTAVLLLGGCVAGGIWLDQRMTDFMCGNQVVERIGSPGGRFEAIVFERDCGATTGFSTQISLVIAETRLPNEGGNVLVCDSDHGAAPSGPGGGPPVKVKWLSDRLIQISYHPRARLFRNEPVARICRTTIWPWRSCDEITIKYAKL